MNFHWRNHDQVILTHRKTLRRLTAENPDTDYYFNGRSRFPVSVRALERAGGNLPPGHSGGGCPGPCFQEKLDAQILHLKEILGARIEKLDTPNIDISSETLRSWIANGHSLRYYVPNPVISYIEEQRIYSRN